MNMNRSSKSASVAAAGLTLLFLGIVAVPGFAHTPLLYLDGNGDGTIYVEAGFSDGSSGAGMTVRLEDEEGNTLWEGVLDAFGAVESVPIPEIQPYYAVFEGGPGHVVRKEGLYETDTTASEVTSNAAPVDTTADASTSTPTSSVAEQEVTPSDSGSVSSWAPAATLGAGWSVAESTDANDAPYKTVLWVIAGLLGFVALQLAFLAFGVALLAGTRLSLRRNQGPHVRE